MLCVFDSLFLVCTIICFTLPLFSSVWTLYTQPFVFPWVFPLLQIALNGSTWSTVAVTVQRFSSVVLSGQRERFSSGFYTLSVIILTSLWNIPRFLELQTCYSLNNTQISFCDIKNHSDCQVN